MISTFSRSRQQHLLMRSREREELARKQRWRSMASRVKSRCIYRWARLSVPNGKRCRFIATPLPDRRLRGHRCQHADGTRAKRLHASVLIELREALAPIKSLTTTKSLQWPARVWRGAWVPGYRIHQTVRLYFGFGMDECVLLEIWRCVQG